jgi:hypothetical protein
MQNELSVKAIEGCLAIWLKGSNLREAARKYKIPMKGLSDAIAAHTGKTRKQLEELRFEKIARQIVVKVLPIVKKQGFIPNWGEFYQNYNTKPAIIKLVCEELKQMGYKPRLSHIPLVSAENESEIVKQFKEGKERTQIACEMNLSLYQVNHILKKYVTKHKDPICALQKQEKNERVFQAAVAKAKELNRIPIGEEWQGITHSQKIPILRKYLEEKGFKYVPLPTKHTPEKLLTILRNLAAQLGHTPGGNELYKATGINRAIYANYFGSYTKAQTAAGLKPNKRGIPKGYFKMTNQHMA